MVSFPSLVLYQRYPPRSCQWQPKTAHLWATENCTLLGEDVSAGADILPVMPVGRVGLDAGSGATGVLANTRRDAADPAVT